ncbi:MAG: helix-turn-helix transcriptional regulator [Chlorobi bacterium]|nr:helix-turn-helix transcriptional regulator [Chlorobiota bacterium]
MYNKNAVRKKIYIKNMFGKCCIRIVKKDFEDNHIQVLNIKQGFAEIEYNSANIDIQKISEILALSDLSLIKNNEEKIIEKLKITVRELIFEMNNVDSIAKKSEYIIEKLGLNYRYLSRLFSKYELITLEKYIISNKIERIKQLISENEYSLSEIAYMMDYSSVQYLSTQFKKEAGITVSDYKELIT